MSAPARLAVFAVALVAVFGGGWALGAIVADEPDHPATNPAPVTSTTMPSHRPTGHEQD